MSIAQNSLAQPWLTTLGAPACRERLRQTLLDLCLKCPDIAQQASDLLLVAEDEAVSVHESDEESNRSDVAMKAAVLGTMGNASQTTKRTSGSTTANVVTVPLMTMG
ncbi:MAG: hypothetical protein FRX48_05066 [Lasallia pustulata]|uniref:Uncharacterized protein n=1 Tax=Lasallia pustulata TaxID=136370 RepID=A0A5M8PQC7_9LECA|nr:MAG: hypothetical protein FRX48_05066 [Lasallia pustulata]